MSERSGLTKREAYWQDHLRRCEAAGRTLAAYAAENGLKVGALYEAKSRLKRKGALPEHEGATPPRFLRVVTQEALAPAPVYGRVHLPNAVTLELGGSLEQWEVLLAGLARL